MIDLTQAKTTEVGKDAPLKSSKAVIDSIVDDAVKDAALPESPNKREKGMADEPAQVGEVGSPKPLDIQAEKEGVSVKESESEGEPETTDEDEGGEAEDKVKDKEEEEEDLIPRSKVQDRIDKLTAEKHKLEEELRRRDQKTPTTQEEKLERLSVSELKALKRQTKLAQRSEQDDERFQALLDLEEKIDQTIGSWPVRFQSKQVENLKAVLPELAKIDPEVTQGKGKLWSIAAGIYQRTGSFQSSEMGQVEAMMLAAEHLELLNSKDSGKEQVSTLSRKVNQLKAKTSLEGKTRVAQEQGVNIAKLREKARTGDMLDKENFFREALVPEEFLQP